MDPRYGTCFMSPFWCLEVRDGFCMTVKFAHPYSKGCVEMGKVTSSCMKFKGKLVDLWKILSSHIGAFKDSRLMGCDALSTGKWLQISWTSVKPPFSGSSSPRRVNNPIRNWLNVMKDIKKIRWHWKNNTFSSLMFLQTGTNDVTVLWTLT